MTNLRDDPAEARRLLTERRAEAERSLDQVEESAASVEADPQQFGGTPVDKMQQRATASEAVRRRRRELLRIEAALERLESGEFGHCLACGAAIPNDRLELDPAAVLCLDCAERA